MQISVPAILGIVFVTLKLSGVIEWSWLWVLAPFWIPIGVSILLFICMVAFVSIGTSVVHFRSWYG